MCTVSYIPVKGGFVLTSNRDESSQRAPSLKPDFYEHEQQSLYYPKDPQAGGSWIAVAEDERVVCLLNGAFTTHKHTPPYNRSRGLVLLETFQYNTAFDFYCRVNLNNVEPFTLLLVWAGQVFEFKWNGKDKHFISLPKTPCLWASATLYDTEAVARKKQWLQDFLYHNAIVKQESMLQFHRQGGELDPINGMCIDRPNGLKTQSITSVQLINGEFSVMQDTFSSDIFVDQWYSQAKDQRF